MGVTPGVSDHFLPYPTHGWHGLWLEMKRDRSCSLTDKQLEWLRLMDEQHYGTAVAYGAEHAIGVVMEYLNGNHQPNWKEKLQTGEN